MLDVLRSTCVCYTLEGVADVVRGVARSDMFTVERIKNRLHRAHNATGSSQYRDLLMTLRVKGSRLCSELQVTLLGLYAIKSEGAHSCYRVLRGIDAREDDSIVLAGDIQREHLPTIASGLVLTIEVAGATMACDRLQGPIANSLSCKSCQVTVLEFVGVQGVQGETLARTFLAPAVASQLRWTLRKLAIKACGLCGPIPPHVWTELAVLAELNLARNSLDGDALPRDRQVPLQCCSSLGRALGCVLGRF